MSMGKPETRNNRSDDSAPSETNTSLPSLDLSNTDMENREATVSRPCLRKRRIIIRRIGRRKGRNRFCKPSSETQNSKNSETRPGLDFKSKRELEAKETAETHQRSEKLPSNPEKTTKDDNDQTHLIGYDKQVYFLTELLQKPLLDVLITYYDLQRKVYVQKKPSSISKKHKKELFNNPLQNYHLRRYGKILQSLELTPNQTKVWKSKVLKTIETRNKENSAVTLRSVLNIIKRESVLKKLFKYECANLLNRHKIVLPRHRAKDISWLNESTADMTHVADKGMVPTLQSEISLNPNIDSGSVETCSGEEGSWKISPQMGPTLGEFVLGEMGNPNVTVSSGENSKTGVEFKTEVKGTCETEVHDLADSKVLVNDPEGESICSQESDEPISLYYSKAANLASPLFDMKRFIYPDHIHYSYKHVKKKGFDVDINGGFPLLVRESLTMGTPVKMGSKSPEFEITRRPMDLSFAATNAFSEWQNNDQNDLEVVFPEKRIQKCTSGSSGKKERNSSVVDLNKNEKTKKTKWFKENSERNDSRSSFADFDKSKPKPYENFSNIKYLYSTKDYILIEKLLKMHMQFNNEFEKMRKDRKPVQISSTQLHSNKGRVSSTYNPAIFLQENKTRSEKKKVETQEERTKDMFARLEREALLQSKNVQKSFGQNRTT